MAMRSAYSVWGKRPLAAMHKGVGPAEKMPSEQVPGQAAYCLDHPEPVLPLAIYTDWDVVAIRMQVMDLAATVGFARSDQLSLAAILSGLARQIMDIEYPGSVLITAVNSRKRGISVLAERMGTRRPLLQPVLLRGQQLLDDVSIRQEKDRVSVAFAKWLPTWDPTVSVAGHTFAPNRNPTGWPNIPVRRTNFLAG